MKLGTAKRLHDARLAYDEVQVFCAGVSKEAFLTEGGLKLIVQKLIEIVGEALRQAYLMEPDVVDRIPGIRRIIDTRNRIVHGQDSVDFGLLWDIVQHRMSALERAISDGQEAGVSRWRNDPANAALVDGAIALLDGCAGQDTP